MVYGGKQSLRQPAVRVKSSGGDKGPRREMPSGEVLGWGMGSGGGGCRGDSWEGEARRAAPRRVAGAGWSLWRYAVGSEGAMFLRDGRRVRRGRNQDWTEAEAGPDDQAFRPLRSKVTGHRAALEGHGLRMGTSG